MPLHEPTSLVPTPGCRAMAAFNWQVGLVLAAEARAERPLPQDQRLGERRARGGERRRDSSYGAALQQLALASRCAL